MIEKQITFINKFIAFLFFLIFHVTLWRPVSAPLRPPILKTVD